MRRNHKQNSTRDPDRTRRRILAAALAEFSAKGFAGARVDAIARRARGNKRMLYHYFGNKADLFSAVLRFKMAERCSLSEGLPEDQAERLPFWFARTCEDPDGVRLLEWEALQDGNQPVIDEASRRADFAKWRERLRQRQLGGFLNPDFDPACLALALQSLMIFPTAFPQIVRLITGKSVTDPGFQNDYRRFLRLFALAFKPTDKSHSH